MNKGWIKLHRKFLQWEWFDKPEMVQMFIFLLLDANHADKEWRGIDIKRGQLVTSLANISAKTNLSIRTIRTCIKRLKSTNEIAVRATNKYSIITICNYDDYQDKENESDKQNDKQTDNQTTNKRQTNDKQTTTNKNEKNDKNEKNNKDTNVSMSIDEQSTQVNLSYEAIINFFNAKTNGVFGKVRYPISEKRKGMLRARIREHGKQAFAEVVLKAANSEFLKGNNSRGFQATFDWLIKPNNFQKTLEGNYDNRESIKYETNERDHATAKRHSEIAELTRVAIEEEERNNSNLW